MIFNKVGDAKIKKILFISFMIILIFSFLNIMTIFNNENNLTENYVQKIIVDKNKEIFNITTSHSVANKKEYIFSIDNYNKIIYDINYLSNLTKKTSNVILNEKVPIKKTYKQNLNEDFALDYKIDININDYKSFLLLGTDGNRTDTIMVVFYNFKLNTIKIISIPRDTYFPIPGYNGLGQKKINAIYNFQKIGGAKGLKYFIEKKFDIKLEFYIELNYKGIKKIIDSIGGVSINVPFDMNYDDPYSNPPLHIHFKNGKQILSGQDSIEFLRWRKNNDKSNSNGGDIGRINRQQLFLNELFNTIKTKNIPIIISNSIENIETEESGFFPIDGLPELSDDRVNHKQIAMCYKASKEESFKVILD
jgi:LCP family protein required for cell wall assembly